MSSLFLHISDAALREALVEQIAFAKLGAPMLCDTPQSMLQKTENKKEATVLIDGEDKKVESLVQTITGRVSAVLAVGGGEMEGVTESFAKPLRLGHLITRLRYYIETAPLLRDQSLAFGPYKLEPQNRCLIYADRAEPIRLTEKETALLVFLGNRAEPATRSEILAHVWGYDEKIDTHTLETHIYQLRRKLDQEKAEWLVNEAGAYRLVRE